jgi:hypothetical protein
MKEPTTDPIVDEVRRARDAYAARFNYDLDAMFLDIKERERTTGKEFIADPPIKSGAPNAAVHPQLKPGAA